MTCLDFDTDHIIGLFKQIWQFFTEFAVLTLRLRFSTLPLSLQNKIERYITKIVFTKNGGPEEDWGFDVCGVKA